MNRLYERTLLGALKTSRDTLREVHNFKLFSNISLCYFAPKPDRHRCNGPMFKPLDNSQGICNAFRDKAFPAHPVCSRRCHKVSVTQIFSIMNRGGDRGAKVSVST